MRRSSSVPTHPPCSSAWYSSRTTVSVAPFAARGAAARPALRPAPRRDPAREGFKPRAYPNPTHGAVPCEARPWPASTFRRKASAARANDCDDVALWFAPAAVVVGRCCSPRPVRNRARAPETGVAGSVGTAGRGGSSAAGATGTSGAGGAAAGSGRGGVTGGSGASGGSASGEAAADRRQCGRCDRRQRGRRRFRQQPAWRHRRRRDRRRGRQRERRLGGRRERGLDGGRGRRDRRQHADAGHVLRVAFGQRRQPGQHERALPDRHESA